MRIQFFFKDVTVPADILSSVRRRALFAFGRYGQRIRATRIRVGNCHGSQGHAELLCEIQVDFVWGDPLVVRERSMSLQTAVAAALERAERDVRRRIDVGEARRKVAVSAMVS